MSIDTIKRFDRIVAILIQLQSKKVVKARDLADRFQVSLRTVYRDIRTLESAGVPIYSEAGTGYSIMEGYRLPPVMFTREEAGSFVAAEKLMQKFTDRSLGLYYESAMYKIKSVLRGREKDWIDTLESQIVVSPANILFNDNIHDALAILLESIAERKQVFLKYQSVESENPSERNIEPVGIFHENNYWYVLGYCHLRSDYRQFRTDRILDIKRTAESFIRQHGTIEEHRPKYENKPKTRIKILVDKKIVRYLGSGRKYYGFVSEKIKNDQVEMTFLTTDAEQGFPRWYLMFADYATIVEPESLKERIVEILEKGRSRLLD
ncbi:helix-turn-helix transcriptional regulator [Abyssalbus ytuae]|uniref:YafY family transcriptional regulator n=1 Tax=Abyssalbus ytuae TaxID=2926907 RepID=A0A9E6ZRA7_9FLAO|nr:YafY family protein [Abyssalbus ytuae]UOB19474.1 YafY family transcriptional regulator [Abyssalbus ytuae]